MEVFHHSQFGILFTYYLAPSSGATARAGAVGMTVILKESLYCSPLLQSRRHDPQSVFPTGQAAGRPAYRL